MLLWQRMASVFVTVHAYKLLSNGIRSLNHVVFFVEMTQVKNGEQIIVILYSIIQFFPSVIAHIYSLSPN